MPPPAPDLPPRPRAAAPAGPDWPTIGLGAWLCASVLAWPHSPGPAVVTFTAGAVAIVLGAGRRASWAIALVAGLLFVASIAMGSAGVRTVLCNTVTAAVLFVLALARPRAWA